MPAWPSTLPQSPLLQGFRRTLAKFALQSNMDIGPPKRRLRGTSYPDMAELTFECSTAQKATFVSFYLNDTAGGALTFTIPDPENSGNTVTLGFDLSKGTPTYTVASDDNSAWVVTVPVIVYVS